MKPPCDFAPRYDGPPEVMWEGGGGVGGGGLRRQLDVLTFLFGFHTFSERIRPVGDATATADLQASPTLTRRYECIVSSVSTSSVCSVSPQLH